MQKIQYIFNKEELQCLMRAIRQCPFTRYKGHDYSFLTDRDTLIVYMALFLGLRINEIANAKVTDIDFGEKTYKVRAEISKSKRDSLLPIPYFLLRKLKEYIERYFSRFKEDFLFPSEKNPHVTVCVIHYNFIHYLKKAGLREFYRGINKNGRPLYKYHFHTLRHTYATLFYKKTRDLELTRRLMRHKNIETTSIYVHLVMDDLRKAVNIVFTPKIFNQL